jgi:nicotinamide mononucleotide adenylyltransferase
MKFREFITENKEKHAVMAFGRMNPPTTGHEVLVNKVKSVAKQVGGSHHIILSHSQDAAKNPLTAAQKVKHAKRFFPDTNISVATKEEPNFLTQAAKLHKQGVTHLHMVAGADRTAEYHKLLHKYNGTHEGALFNFKKITVHNAGERDPDAEGTEGMSASKMRKHAGSGNFDDFKQGIPKHVPEHHAKELFRDVRKGMSIKESIDLNEEFEILLEGVHDQSIFKAIFLAGGPGSGKDYVLDNTLDGQGLTEINSDKALEFLMDKEGLDKMMPVGETEKRDFVRGRAKNITELRQQLALLGRNGLIINGTGDDVAKTKRIKDQLEKLGYDTAMLLVNTRDDISAQRNIERGQRGGRAVPEPIRKEKWDSVQLARTEYAQMFGDKYKEFDNSEDLRQADPETVKAKKSELLQLYTGFKEFVSTPPQSEESKFWVANELDKKDTLPVQTDGAEQLPASDDATGEEARKLGLQYYGFGRYGRNGKVTHRSVHGQLVMVTKEEPKQPKIPVSSSSQKPVKPVVKESSDLIYEDGLLRDKAGKLRVFMLRNTAAKEAHTKNGTIIKHNNGYVVKLNGENKNVKLSEEIISNQTKRTSSFGESSSGRNRSTGASDRTNTGTSASSSTGSCCGTSTCTCDTKPTTEETTRSKITLAEIRTRQKEKVIESINNGESGLSMAASGENLGRDTTRIKTLKKPLEELTGDETTMSIGDQKEGELKRIGINLKTFKSKKFVG